MSDASQQPTPGPPDGLETGSVSKPAPPGIPDYKLIRRIAQGGFGEVWLAENALGTFRAVKIVRRAVLERDQRGNYERELNGLRRFEPISRSHEGLVDILHVGVKEGHQDV